MAKEDIDKKKILEELATKLIKLMGLNASLTISEGKEEEFLVNIESTNEAGLIIGPRGRTINSIQTLLTMMFMKRIGEWKRVVVDVSSWRQKEAKRLEELARVAAERAVEVGEPQNLYNLSPSQRRIIHLFLAQDKRVETQSQGEGKDRYLVIIPKK